jgi:transposase
VLGGFAVTGRFADYSVDRDWLFPPTLGELLRDDDLAFFVHKAVRDLDMAPFSAMYSDEGGTAYPPEMYLKLMFYGYSIGVRSSRKLARLARMDIGAMYLCGGLQPEHNAINRFRLKCLPQVKLLFRQVLEGCVRRGMVSFGQISLDGSKIEANASKHSAMSAERIERRIRDLHGVIDDVMATAESEDAVDGADEKLKGLLAEIAKHEGYLDELKERAKAADRELAPSDQINFTDPESRIMETRHDGFQQCYNAQVAVDRDHLVIVAADLTQDCTDYRMLEPMVEQIAQSVVDLRGLKPGTNDDTEWAPPIVCADAGYSSHANLSYLSHKEDINALIAEKRDRTERNRYHKANFRYDAETDTYSCPEGKTLYPPKRQKDPDAERVAYSCRECRHCPHKGQCLQGKSTQANRRVVRHRDDALVEKMRAKMEVQVDIYKKRMSTVEPVWGIMKLVMAFTCFSLRGLEKASEEFLFACSAHNLKRMWHWDRKKRVLSPAQ